MAVAAPFDADEATACSPKRGSANRQPSELRTILGCAARASPDTPPATTKGQPVSSWAPPDQSPTPGGPSSTVGTYSSSWSRPSNVRAVTRSRATRRTQPPRTNPRRPSPSSPQSGRPPRMAAAWPLCRSSSVSGRTGSGLGPCRAGRRPSSTMASTRR